MKGGERKEREEWRRGRGKIERKREKQKKWNSKFAEMLDLSSVVQP